MKNNQHEVKKLTEYEEKERRRIHEEEEKKGRRTTKNNLDEANVLFCMKNNK